MFKNSNITHLIFRHMAKYKIIFNLCQDVGMQQQLTEAIESHVF
jgi:hypothetical protein